MSLPLTIRKNIRDNEPNLKENLARLSTATGKEFELEVDWAAVVANIDPSYKDNIGELYQRDVLSKIAECIEDLCKNDMVKEAFLEATTASKISIRVNDKIPRYWSMKFDNGAIVVEHKKSICNIYEIGQYDLISIMPTPGLPLVIRLNLEKHKPDLDENLEKINALTGTSDWSVEADFEKVLPTLDYSRNTIGETYYKSVMEMLTRNLEQALKSETTKESFNEATSQHKIIIGVDAKQVPYWEIKFHDGTIVVTHKKGDFCNLYEIGNLSLEERIPSPGLPLVTRLNIENNRSDLDENLQKIAAASGVSDWSLEVDFEKLIKLNNYYLKSAGELYYRDVIQQVANNLTRALQDETVKEAFNEATSQHKIIIRITENPKENRYWALFFENGALIVQHKKDVANMYEIGNFDLAAVIPVPGVLSLLARLNIQSSQEALQESLEIIKQATGEDYSFDDSCLEAIYKAVTDYSKNRVGEVILRDAMKFLANNLKSALADDMVKEAFNETATAHQITFRPDAKAPQYWSIKFENGVVVVTFKPDIANMYELGNFSIEKLL